MRILLAGGSGFLGKVIQKELHEHDITLLSRGVNWDPENGRIDFTGDEKFDLVINLCGKPVFCIWTKGNREKLRRSRIQSTQFLIDSLAKLKHPPKKLINASAIGFYGDQGSRILNENEKSDDGFLSSLCKDWEDAAAKFPGDLIILRTGIVLDEKSGALSKMAPIFKLCLGGKIGSGEQYVSWISSRDYGRAIHFLIKNGKGRYNITAPNPVTNLELTKQLGKILKRPTLFSIPAWMVRLYLGSAGKEMLLSSANAPPIKLLKEGFLFQDKTLENYLKGIY